MVLKKFNCAVISHIFLSYHWTKLDKNKSGFQFFLEICVQFSLLNYEHFKSVVQVRIKYGGNPNILTLMQKRAWIFISRQCLVSL